MTIKTTALAAGLLAAMTSTASAATLSLTGSSTGSFTTNTTVTESPIPPGSTDTNYIATGQVTLNEDTGASFLAWCLDLAASVGLNGSNEYIEVDTPYSNSYALNSTRKGQVQAMFDANYGSILVSNAVDAAAFQLGLWDAVYDDGFDLTGGEFQGQGFGANAAAITARAAELLGNAAGYTGGRAYNLTFLESAETPRTQNLVTVSAVPLPAGGLLLLTALAGAGAVVRRRKG